MSTATYNFIRGAGSILDLAPNLGPTNAGNGLSIYRSEQEAIALDWHWVAEDFRKSAELTIQELRQHDEK